MAFNLAKELKTGARKAKKAAGKATPDELKGGPEDAARKTYDVAEEATRKITGAEYAQDAVTYPERQADKRLEEAERVREEASEARGEREQEARASERRRRGRSTRAAMQPTRSLFDLLGQASSEAV